MDATSGSADSPRAARLVRPIQEFLHTETAGGVLLLVAAIVALVWVNSPWGDSYDDLWGAYVTLDLNFVTLKLTLGHWVNDLLMALFFFVVGMEIKREVLRGELSGLRRAGLPIAGALGGMVVPAALYLAFNAGGDGAKGWGIPMATDIAFAVGVLSLIGPRIPLGLKIFLLALAIVDDLGAIAVIALFYTDEVSVTWLAMAGVSLGLTAGAVRAGFKQMWLFAFLGLSTWLFIYESGVHATIAGVAMGLLMPLEPHFRPDELEPTAQTLLEDARTHAAAETRESEEEARAALQELEESARDSRALLDRLEHTLHPWTSFLIVPLFALANAGIALNAGAIRDAAQSDIALGVAAGLILGKPIGITLFAFVAVKSGLATLPENVTWPEVVGVSMIAGIGFTVSIFISGLAFSDPDLIDEAKTGILAASALIGVLGYLVLARVANNAPTANKQAD